MREKISLEKGSVMKRKRRKLGVREKVRLVKGDVMRRKKRKL